jgi:hypothetical protein
MPHFTRDNTEGYSQSDLDELNRRFKAAIAAEEPIADSIRDSHEKNIGERVLAAFDDEKGREG